LLCGAGVMAAVHSFCGQGSYHLHWPVISPIVYERGFELPAAIEAAKVCAAA